MNKGKSFLGGAAVLLSAAALAGCGSSSAKTSADQKPVSYTHLTLPTICSV